MEINERKNRLGVKLEDKKWKWEKKKEEFEMIDKEEIERSIEKRMKERRL